MVQCAEIIDLFYIDKPYKKDSYFVMSITTKGFKPPKKDADFVRYWKLYIDNIVERENFKQSHLKTLEILVDMLLEYDELTKFIKDNGYTYVSEGRNGIQSKPHPEVSIREGKIAKIKDYCKLLDITLMKDKPVEEEDEDDEWS